MRRLVRLLPFLLVVAPLWIVELPPIQDLPNHLARVHVELDLLRGGAAFGDRYELVPLPLPNVAADLLLLPLMAIAPAALAGKVVLSFAILLLVWAGFRFLAAEGAPEMGWLALPVAWNFYVHMGFVSYLLSVALGLLALAHHRRHADRWTWRTRAVFALLATALYLAHLSSFLIVVAAVQVRRLRARGWRSGVVPEPSFLPALLLWALVLWAEPSSSGGVEYPHWSWKIGSLAQVVQAYDPRGGDLVLLGLLAVGALVAVRRIEVDRLPAVGALLVLYLVLPLRALGGSLVDSRVLPFLGFFALAAVRGEARRAKAAGIALAVLATGWAGYQYLRLGPEISRMVRGADVLPRGAAVAPLTEKDRVGRIWVYHHIATWTVSRRDTVTPFLFADPYQHPLRPRQERRVWDEMWFLHGPDAVPDLDAVAADWDYAWLTGATPLDAEIEARGPLVVREGVLRIVRLQNPAE
ncbi:MAG: hypothetical protein R3190_04815 [Thermoanaerobaculia bacterium]|nr:hypothetical protein [Thermoanaerobaculia bacterium]